MDVRIRPGRKGDFLVTVDGTVVWDKLGADRRFPEPKEILAKCSRG